MPDGRDWKLERLQVTNPEATLNIDGLWQGWLTQPRTQVNVRLETSDIGKLLVRLGYPEGIKRGVAKLEGPLSWAGNPSELDYGTLSGNLVVEASKGQFVKLDPGIGKLLGVLSLQSLPRRLSLDFRDLFQEGFAFDNITGDVKIAQGVAQTNNLRMRGVQALVLMEGSADIERETQNLRVVVVPEISAGTAALAYAVINPAIGLGAFLAQAILKKPLTAAGTREFHVSGPWADPKVERVERKFSDDVPNVDAPASAPVKTQ